MTTKTTPRKVKLPSPRVEIKKNTRKEFYAVIIAKNGKTIWETSESYKRKADVRKAILVLAHSTILHEGIVSIGGIRYEIVDTTLKPKK